MRSISVRAVTDAVARLCIDTNIRISPDIREAMERARKAETSPLGREILGCLLDNAQAASDGEMAICQDTGMAVVFLEVGQEVRLEDGHLEEAVHAGVREGYARGYLRKSVVADPFERINTGDNTPAVIHTRLVPGDRLRIVVAPKGFGSENMSAVRMLTPAEGAEGVLDFVVETVDRAGSNPCPPIIVGVGAGGTFETCALLAKKALLRPVGIRHPKPAVAAMEETLLERINRLGIGPAGLGGRTTALSVAIETYPTHIAALPVAVNIGCHVTRHGEVTL